jgi:hypothetical protein
MKKNDGIIPSFVDLDGTIGGREGKWWGNAYGWGFSPVNPVTGRREDRNRIPRALVGFSNALLVSGDRKYVDAWRDMIAAVNGHARQVDGRTEYPTMFGVIAGPAGRSPGAAGSSGAKEASAGPASRSSQAKDAGAGWYGWQREPWSVGTLDVWYWSMSAADRARVGPNPWVEFLEGKNRDYPETALQRDIDSIPRKVESIRADRTPPGKRLADNMLDLNPAATDSLVRLMLGALVPGREGGLLNARLRYFDPERRRAGVPDDVSALVSEIADRRTSVTLVNTSTTRPRTVIVQAGGYGEHQFESVGWDGQTRRLDTRELSVRLAPGAGAILTLGMRRHVNAPTVKFPWNR